MPGTLWIWNSSRNEYFSQREKLSIFAIEYTNEKITFVVTIFLLFRSDVFTKCYNQIILTLHQPKEVRLEGSFFAPSAAGKVVSTQHRAN